MALLGTKITITLSGTGTGTVSSANIPVYTSPVFVLDPISCPSPGPCLNYDTQNSAENLAGPWSFTLIGTPDPGSVFVGWTVTPNCGTNISFMCPSNSTAATELFEFENSDVSYTVNAQFDLNPCSPLSLVPPAFPNGCLNTAYSEAVTGSGGLAPYSYGSFGVLPPGLTPNTVIVPGSFSMVGTPTAIGTYNFFVVVTDSNQCTTEIPISLTIVDCIPPPICYELLSCTGSHVNIIVTNNLGPYVGQVVQILGECFTVSIASTCVGAVALPGPFTFFQDCCSCDPPELYLLTDCTLQTPQIPTTSVTLAPYVGQTIKICDFVSSIVLPVQGGSTFTCFVPNDKGFITQITGPTTGFFYNTTTQLISPYTNPLLLALTPGRGICVNPASPFDVVSMNSAQIYLIQYFLGTIPLTNPIYVNSEMLVADVQWFIDQEIIYPNTTITVVSFTIFTNLVTNVNITAPVTDPLTVEVTNLSNPTFPPITTVSEEFVGSCICYTVTNPGTTCEDPPPFTGVIFGAFPDCVCCNPPLIEPEPPYIPTPPEIDKHTYKITESQCDIDANKTFANAMYDIFKTDAYGMESCCPRNFNQIWIQKELSDLSKIKC
jgi:hypothetical protein